MKYPCDMVADLLPLYHDSVCSETSKNIVEEHLTECDSCKLTMQRMKDTTYDTRLREDRKNIVGHHAKIVKRRSLVVGLGMSAVLTIPILICLIVNLVTSHALDWFFIVLTSLMLIASLSAVPLIVEERKGLWTLGSFSTSLLLLFLSCCLYSGEKWFFVASVSSLFGLSVVFMPYVLKQLPLKGLASRHKGVIAMSLDTILLYGIIITSGIYRSVAGYWRLAFIFTTVITLFVWLLFVIIRYMKSGGFIRAGLCVFAGSVFFSLFHDFSEWIMSDFFHISLTGANLWDWSSDALINANCYLLILLSGGVIGIILLIIGIVRRNMKHTDS